MDPPNGPVGTIGQNAPHAVKVDRGLENEFVYQGQLELNVLDLPSNQKLVLTEVVSSATVQTFSTWN